MRFSQSSAAALVATLPIVVAQTFTACDPTKKDCPSDTGLNSGTYSADFTSGSDANSSWSAAAYTTISYGDQGAMFSISNAKEAPTIQTDFYIFFGRIDVKMKAAPGQGIVSSIVLESDDLDEIDWEFLGGNTKQVESNFFGKGNTTAYDRALYHDVSSPQDTFHTYTVDWNSDRIEFMIDGSTVRTLSSDDPLTVDGKNYPQTPMRLKLGSWCAGVKGKPQGTIEWAGGITDFSQGPFEMYVESVNIQNTNPADSYEYVGKSGSWESIKINKNGGSSGGSSVTSTVAATGSGNGATAGSSSAPTASHSVVNVQQTQAAVSKTVTGSSYSMNSASASAQNANGTMHVSATTQVPGASPSGAGGVGGSPSATASGSGSASQTGNAASSLRSVMTSGSLLVLMFGFFML